MKNIKFIKLFKAFLLIAILLSSSALFAVQSTFASVEESPVVENTSELCHDEIDNDENTLVDASDPGCMEFYVVVDEPVDVCPNLEGDQESVPEGFVIDDGECSPIIPPPMTDVCSNIEGSQSVLPEGFHFVGDEESGICISNIEPEATSTPETTPTPPAPTSHTSGRSHSGSGLPTGGSVLGAFTSDEASSTNSGVCTPYISSFMKFGQKNKIEDVIRLQKFLNKELNLTIPVTGFFGKKTEAAVKQFQAKYATEILKPWVDAGIATVLESTGYVYKTTLWFVNSKSNNCATTFPFPSLK